MKFRSRFGAGLETTRLGFGCSALLGPRSEEEALRLLSTVYNSGIRHFDTAPIYGYGEAEKVLGKFLQGRRDQVTVTTKFGIEPGITFPGHRFVLATVRKAMRLVKPIRRLVRKNAGQVMQGGDFSVDKAKDSLDSSLTKLNTDYVDVFLLHDCSSEDVTEELILFLDQAMSRGRIKLCGLGTSKHEIDRIVSRFPGLFKVLQYKYVDYEDSGEETLVINHGIFDRLYWIYNKIKHDPELFSKWDNEIVELDFNKVSVANLLMSRAYRHNENRILLFSSTKNENILSNVLSISKHSPANYALEPFEDILEQIYKKYSENSNS